jgi:hypothetical protein
VFSEPRPSNRFAPGKISPGVRCFARLYQSQCETDRSPHFARCTFHFALGLGCAEWYCAGMERDVPGSVCTGREGTASHDVPGAAVDLVSVSGDFAHGAVDRWITGGRGGAGASKRDVGVGRVGRNARAIIGRREIDTATGKRREDCEGLGDEQRVPHPIVVAGTGTMMGNLEGLCRRVIGGQEDGAPSRLWVPCFLQVRAEKHDAGSDTDPEDDGVMVGFLPGGEAGSLAASWHERAQGLLGACHGSMRRGEGEHGTFRVSTGSCAIEDAVATDCPMDGRNTLWRRALSQHLEDIVKLPASRVESMRGLGTEEGKALLLTQCR